MAFNLRNRNFLKLLDFTPQEIKFLLDLSMDLKKAKYAGTEQTPANGQKHTRLSSKKLQPVHVVLSKLPPTIKGQK